MKQYAADLQRTATLALLQALKLELSRTTQHIKSVDFALWHTESALGELNRRQAEKSNAKTWALWNAYKHSGTGWTHSAVLPQTL